jgi:hypothetical protein
MYQKIRSLVTILLITINCAGAQSLPTQTSTLFSGSGNCALCHQAGSTNSNVLRDVQGNDVSPVTLWRSTMMANSTKDPFWQAKVTAEVAANPHLKEIIEDKCLTCHAPLGRTEAISQGSEYYSFEEMKQDDLAMDGVSCTSCHQIKPDNLGTTESYSGQYIIENDRIIYGPYQNPITMPMQNMVNYTPTFGEHTHQSELCATCHTLFTPYVDNEGDVVGEAPEQTPYLEWQNSVYPGQNIECQTCHMPEIDDPVVISTMPMMLNSRAPFAKHYFVGGNAYMLRMLKKYRTDLGLTPSDAHFDSTIARTFRLLQRETVELDASYQWLHRDTLQVKIAVNNKTGHKFPTSYPSRRAWIHFEALDENGVPVFESGKWNNEIGEIIDLDNEYEPHYDKINKSDQVQVYQSLMMDVDNKVTYTLLRAADFIKDNRIPPEGFTKSGPGYDSTAIIGLADEDPNFNDNGSGIDTVTYKISGLNNSQSYTINVKIYYQSLSPRFVEDLWQYDTPEVARFKSFYQDTPNYPLVLDSLSLFISNPTSIEENKAIEPNDPVLVSAYPNPFNPEITINVSVKNPGVLSMDIYNILGEQIRSYDKINLVSTEHTFSWNAKSDQGESLPSGEYIIRIQFSDKSNIQKFTRVKKILYLK